MLIETIYSFTQCHIWGSTFRFSPLIPGLSLSLAFPLQHTILFRCYPLFKEEWKSHFKNFFPLLSFGASHSIPFIWLSERQLLPIFASVSLLRNECYHRHSDNDLFSNYSVHPCKRLFFSVTNIREVFRESENKHRKSVSSTRNQRRCIVCKNNSADRKRSFYRNSSANKEQHESVVRRFFIMKPFTHNSSNKHDLAAPTQQQQHQHQHLSLKLLPCRAPLQDLAACFMVAHAASIPLCISYPTTASPVAGISDGAASGTDAGTAISTAFCQAEKEPARDNAGTGAGGDTCSVSINTTAFADTDACLLQTELGYISSAYAICLYLASQATAEKRQLLLLGFAGKEQQPSATKQLTSAGDMHVNWEMEDLLAWAAFKLRTAVRGVRKDVLLHELDLLESKIGSSTAFQCSSIPTLPAIFVFCALRYSFPNNDFAAWPRTAQLVAALDRSSLFSATAAAVPPSSFPFCCPVLSPSLLSTSSVIAKNGEQRPKVDLARSRQPCKTELQSEQEERRQLITSQQEQREGVVPAGDHFYITTAINYTNGPPHMGHVYEGIAADVIARYHRVFGRSVFFLTGTDEHGQKIANTAAQQGVSPQSLCDMHAARFLALDKQLCISFDYFIRTTAATHKERCQWLWRRVSEAGDIYLGSYSGWYNEREETFVSEQEAKLCNYTDPMSGKPLQQMQEPSYFFKMSKYQKRLIEHIQANPQFIQPEDRRTHILKRLETPLLDLSCSRTSFQWGVPVPGDEKHVMYVWFDALTNYISAIGVPDGELYRRFWPANLHLIGKDILWFHTVIWPCILMAAKMPLPHSVFGHGFVLAADGEKMSKSLRNVVDPVEVLESHSVDSFRFYLMREARFGSDLRFSVEGLIACTNAELADTLGNLVHRALSLCEKFCCKKVPQQQAVPSNALPPFNCTALINDVENCMQQLLLREALEAVMEACRSANKFLSDWAPWNLTAAAFGIPNLAVDALDTKLVSTTVAITGEELHPVSAAAAEEATLLLQKQQVVQQEVVRAALEAVYVLAHLLEPFIPCAAAQIFQKLNTPKRTLQQLSPFFDNLVPGTPTEVGDILFVKRKSCSSDSYSNTVAKLPFQKCELRVARIIRADPHPLYIAAKKKEAAVPSCSSLAASPGLAEAPTGAVSDGAMAPVDPLVVLTLNFAAEGAERTSIDKKSQQNERKTAVVRLNAAAAAQPELLLHRTVIALYNAKPMNIKGVMSHTVVLTAAKQGGCTGDGELLSLAEKDPDPISAKGGNDTKREDSVPTACDSHISGIHGIPNHIAAVVDSPVGALVEAAGYPPILRSRENIRSTELVNMNWSVSPEGVVLLNDNIPLHVAHKGKQFVVIAGAETPRGKLILI